MRAKYRAKSTRVDGIRFHSKREADRYAELILMEKSGLISKLALQTAFPLIFEGVTICKYIADFTYWQDGQLIIEDVKGFKTPVYRIKKKMMRAMGFEITETK